MESPDTTQSISIREFLRYALRHWLIPLGILLLAPFCGLAYSLLQTPLYGTLAELTVLGGSTAQTAGIAREAEAQLLMTGNNKSGRLGE